MSKVLIIGFGSIGQRHARLFDNLGCTVGVVSRRAIDHGQRYESLPQALTDFAPDVVVVASATAEHAQDIRALVANDFTGQTLVEKPLTSTLEDLPIPLQGGVAYNLRFHPLMQALKATLSDRKLLAFDARIGQYLPDWRPGTDYRDSYSARAAQGGGVLRDLSHELDYTAWLCGPWTRLAALGGQLSHLEITSEDVVTVLMKTEHCPAVSIHLNYLQDVPQRQIVAVTDTGTIIADFIQGTLTDQNGTQTFACDRDDTYVAQDKALLAGQSEILCTFAEGRAVVETIITVERAITDKQWINR